MNISPEKPNMVFLNRSFDKKRLKALLLWFRLNLSESAALEAVEILQGLGFRSATQGAISLGLDDLKTPTSKGDRVFQAQLEVALAYYEHRRGNRTPVELFQHLVDTWHRTSQDLTAEVVQLFHSTERLNPVYMMAFSGARGNISQVRQLVGMRGLMADPRGQIVGFPILSNFREGLTVTEYFVSCYGARKGVVDTAIRTADAGYLTRRLADVSHHFVVRTTNCGTHRNICLRDIKEGQKTILPLASRLVGRVLGEQVSLLNKEIAFRNQEITPDLASKLASQCTQVYVRSPLTCSLRWGVCQLCYGWGLSEGRRVTLGEAVGIIAAQSIGEPGTQLTLRTFHTGGVFSGDLLSEIRAPYGGTVFFPDPLQGLLVRTPHGQIAFLTKVSGKMILFLSEELNKEEINRENSSYREHKLDQPLDQPLDKEFFLQPSTVVFVRQEEKVLPNQLLAEFSSSVLQPINDHIEVTQQVLSEAAGEVWFKEIEYGNRKGSGSGSLGMDFSSQKLGEVWVLGGKPSTFSLSNKHLFEQAVATRPDRESRSNNRPAKRNKNSSSIQIASGRKDSHSSSTSYLKKISGLDGKAYKVTGKEFRLLRSPLRPDAKFTDHQSCFINLHHDDHLLKYHYSLGYSQSMNFASREEQPLLATLEAYICFTKKGVPLVPLDRERISLFSSSQKQKKRVVSYSGERQVGSSWRPWRPIDAKRPTLERLPQKQRGEEEIPIPWLEQTVSLLLSFDYQDKKSFFAKSFESSKSSIALPLVLYGWKISKHGAHAKESVYLFNHKESRENLDRSCFLVNFTRKKTSWQSLQSLKSLKATFLLGNIMTHKIQRKRSETRFASFVAVPKAKQVEQDQEDQKQFEFLEKKKGSTIFGWSLPEQWKTQTTCGMLLADPFFLQKNQGHLFCLSSIFRDYKQHNSNGEKKNQFTYEQLTYEQLTYEQLTLLSFSVFKKRFFDLSTNSLESIKSKNLSKEFSSSKEDMVKKYENLCESLSLELRYLGKQKGDKSVNLFQETKTKIGFLRNKVNKSQNSLKELLETFNLNCRPSSVTSRGFFSPLKQNSAFDYVNTNISLSSFHIVESLPEKNHTTQTTQTTIYDQKQNLLTLNSFWQALSLKNYPRKVTLSGDRKKLSDFSKNTAFENKNLLKDLEFNQAPSLSGDPVQKQKPIWLSLHLSIDRGFISPLSYFKGFTKQKQICDQFHENTDLSSLSRQPTERFAFGTATHDFSQDLLLKSKRSRNIQTRISASSYLPFFSMKETFLNNSKNNSKKGKRKKSSLPMRDLVEIGRKKRQVKRNDGSLDQHIVHTISLPITSFPYIIPSSSLSSFSKKVDRPIQGKFLPLIRLIMANEESFFQKNVLALSENEKVNLKNQFQISTGSSVNLSENLSKQQNKEQVEKTNSFNCCSPSVQRNRNISSKESLLKHLENLANLSSVTKLSTRSVFDLFRNFLEKDFKDPVYFTENRTKMFVIKRKLAFLGFPDFVDKIKKTRKGFHENLLLKTICNSCLQSFLHKRYKYKMKNSCLRVSQIGFLVSLPIKIINNPQGRYTSAHLKLFVSKELKKKNKVDAISLNFKVDKILSLISKEKDQEISRTFFYKLKYLPSPIDLYIKKKPDYRVSGLMPYLGRSLSFSYLVAKEADLINNGIVNRSLANYSKKLSWSIDFPAKQAKEKLQDRPSLQEIPYTDCCTLMRRTKEYPLELHHRCHESVETKRKRLKYNVTIFSSDFSQELQSKSDEKIVTSYFKDKQEQLSYFKTLGRKKVDPFFIYSKKNKRTNYSRNPVLGNRISIVSMEESQERGDTFANGLINSNLKNSIFLLGLKKGTSVSSFSSEFSKGKSKMVIGQVGIERYTASAVMRRGDSFHVQFSKKKVKNQLNETITAVDKKSIAFNGSIYLNWYAFKLDQEGSPLKSTRFFKDQLPRKDSPRNDSPRKDSPRNDSPRKDSPRKDSPRKDSPDLIPFLSNSDLTPFLSDSDQVTFALDQEEQERLPEKKGKNSSTTISSSGHSVWPLAGIEGIDNSLKDGSIQVQNNQWDNDVLVFPGQLVPYGEKICQKFATTESGQVFYIDSQRTTLRKAQTVLIYSQAILAVLPGEWVQKGSSLMTLSYQKLVTGDIVQGLPKIEQFFEAPLLKDGNFWSDSLQAKLNLFFQEHREKLPLAEAVRKGFSDIQRLLVEGVQRVYISQGVLIADKHLEVIVRQMTCKARILYSGDTGFLRNELVSLDKIESVNQVTYGQKALYHPQVRGITDASLESESFLSAASFQETTRVLSRDAVIGKTDLMRGLKERVIVGELIQAGTGLANNNVYNLLLDQ